MRNIGTDPGAFNTGLDALCVYALLQASHAIHDERLGPHGEFVRSMLNGVKQMPASYGPVTYARSLRANALAFMDRPEDRKVMEADVDFLLKSANRGAFTYRKLGTETPRSDIASAIVEAQLGGDWDNSNSQYGLLGIWAGAEVGVKVPGEFWAEAQNHWAQTVREDGQWNYNNKRVPSLSMTAAGVASLFVTQDYLDAANSVDKLGQSPFSKPLEMGLRYLEGGDHCLEAWEVGWKTGYTLYSLERVGLASGFKYLGTHDWYRELAKTLVARQQPSGAWPVVENGTIQAARQNNLIETAYALLFLSRGRHPILMNKLRFDGDETTPGFWSNRPRDVANLARFASRELERPLNWQVVSINRTVAEWSDCPILYIASHEAPPLKPGDYEKLKAFVNAGGLIFTHADGSSEKFNAWVAELAKKIAPTLRLEDIRAGAPAVFEHVSAGRQAAHSGRVQRRAAAAGAFARGFVAAVAAPFGGDAAGDIPVWREPVCIRGRQEQSAQPPGCFLALDQLGAAEQTLDLIRLHYKGGWDPEPMAMERLDKLLRGRTSVGLNVIGRDVKDLSIEDGPIAHLTGTAAATFDASERKAIQTYVSAGGVLLIDSCGGSASFTKSIQALLPSLFPAAQPWIVSDSHPIRAGLSPGIEPLPALKLRPYAIQKLGQTPPRIELYEVGKGCVIFSPADLTSGLLGTHTWGIVGLDPASAQAFVMNTLIWAWTR